MIRAIFLTASASLALAALPQTAAAQCAPTSGGSASVTCTQGVTIIRQAPGRAPSIDPATAAQLKLQRQQRIDALQQRAAQNRLAQDRLDLERRRVNNQSYLYRDANSPLRQRTRPQGYGTRGFRSGTGGIIVVGR